MTLHRLALHAGNPKRLGRGLVGVPLDQMASLGLRPGDVVAIHGARLTHARVMPAPRGGTYITASDEVIHNAGASDIAPRLERADLPRLTSVLLRATYTQPTPVARIAETLHDLALTEGDMLNATGQGGTAAGYEVVGLTPSPAGLFCDSTTVTLQADPRPAPDYDTVGGLSDQIARVHEMVAIPLLRPDLFARLGVAAPRGVLFVGPPGSGKTLLARAIADRTSAAFFVINGPEIVSKHYGESESALRTVFAAAEKAAPAIVFIDEIDAIAPRRDSLSGEKQVERRVVAQLLTLMDGLSDRGRVVVMAATNLPDSLDPALRRPGRFDREIVFAPPSPAQRREILEIHLREAPLAADADLDLIARDSHGYVGADLAALAREAALAALDRSVDAAGGEQQVDANRLFITQEDLAHGLRVTSPSALRDMQVESPTVRFTDVGGLDDVKRALTEAVIWPQQHRGTFAALGVRPASGVLLSGPPGSGKTLLARALAQESGMNFIPVRPTRIISQFLGDAERAIAELFAKARHTSPCLIFLDELDSLAPRRTGKEAALDRIVAQLLTEMDGLASNAGIVVLGATNRAGAIDPALTRPGRFDTVIRIGLPDLSARRAILGVHARGPAWAQPGLLDDLALRTDGFSGAALAGLSTLAARSALHRGILGAEAAPQVTSEDIELALIGHNASEQARQDDFIDKNGGPDAHS
jgi:transitional endoplasmic reticulum ATPase